MKEGFTEKIWEDFKAGSDEALESIYRTHVQKLYNYARQFTSNADLVKDIIQDLFCELIQNRRKLGQTTSVKFYLFACLRNKLLKILKKSSNFVQLDEALYQNPEGGFRIDFFKDQEGFSDFFQPDISATLETAFNNLPHRQREATILYYYENLSYQEIAEIMQIGKVKSVRALMYRALESLHKIIHQFDRPYAEGFAFFRA